MNYAKTPIFLAALLALAACILVSPAPALAEDPEIEEAIDDLIDTVGMSEATEDIRFGNTGNGGLRFFGVPPDAYAETDQSKSGAVEKAVTFLKDHAVAFGVKSLSVGFDLTKDRTVDTRQYLRFQQTYEDIPVFGGEAIVQMNEDQNVTAVIPSLMTNTADLDDEVVSLTPVITAGEAEDYAMDTVVTQYVQAAEAENVSLTPEEIEDFSDDLIIAEDTTLEIYDPSLLLNTGSMCLAYKVTVAGDTNSLEAYVVLINAASGDCVLSYPLTASALNRRIRDQYNSVLYWPLGLLRRTEGDPPAQETDVNLAYDYLGDTYDFYWNYHGRDSYDDVGATLSATVRSCRIMMCLFTCPCGNAQWNGRWGRFFFGDGMVADDITAHEYTHAVTDCTSVLISHNQSGAINESFSDVWGEFVDQTNGRGTDTEQTKWLIGEDCALGPGRSMKNPPETFGNPIIDPSPDRVGSPHWYTGPKQDKLIHLNCGVNNKLCYLLTDGDSFNGRTVSGMGLATVVDLYYECQTNLHTQTANYYALYFALQQAAVNLGLSPEQRSNIEEACRAVEIRPSASVTIHGSSGQPLVQFTDAGDLIMHEGQIHVQENIQLPNDPILILKDEIYNPLALVNLVTGDLHLAGNVFPFFGNDISPYVQPNSLIIRNAKHTPVAFICSQGFWIWIPLTYVPAGSLVISGNIIDLAN